jgi:hypothetical protein
MGGSWYKGSQGRTVNETSSRKPSWALWYMTVIPAMHEAEVGGAWSEASLGETKSLFEKYTKTKNSWGHGPSGSLLA